MESLLLVVMFLVHFGLFLVPGLAATAALGRQRPLPPAETLVTATMMNALLGYLCFWVYFLNPTAGRVFSILVMGAAVGLVAALAPRRHWWQALADRDVRGPIVLMGLVGLFYLALLYAVDVDVPAGYQPAFRFPSLVLSNDNLIPLWFADRLYEGADPRHLLADWLSSDRPPLQTGLVLLQYPLLRNTFLEYGFHYEILATILQSTWIPVVWALGRRLGLGRAALAQLFAFLVLAGFFYLHTVYVWPKMLAGALATAPVLSLLRGRHERDRRLRRGDAMLAGAAAALALLAHGGAIFALAALVLVGRPVRSFGRSGCLAGACVFVLLLAPWLAYQRCYDPPGNRLVKWHLAGVRPLDARSTAQALSDSYAQIGLWGAAANRWRNLLALFGGAPGPDVPAAAAPDANTVIGKMRVYQYQSIFAALGILNLGWLPLGLGLRWRHHVSADPMVQRGNTPAAPASSALPRLTALALGGLGVWILFMFGPGATVIHQGPYATFLLLFVVLATVLAQAPLAVSVPLVLLQAAVFGVGSVVGRPTRFVETTTEAYLALLVFAALAGWWLFALGVGRGQSADSG